MKPLAWWLEASRSGVAGDRQHVPDKRGDLIFRDYGADVLLVAHMDHVGESGYRKTRAEPPAWFGWRYVRHVSLDDRLGCWAIEKLHADGVKADLLFTDCEETGRTTGRDFNPPRQYKFILSLDRMGDDAVLYQYLDAARWKRRCAHHFLSVAHGSFSCIASMEHLGVCGVNVGVGYYLHNTVNCWADLYTTAKQLKRAATFIADARNRTWKFTPPPAKPHSYISTARTWAEYQWAMWGLGEDWPVDLNDGRRDYRDHYRDHSARGRNSREWPRPFVSATKSNGNGNGHHKGNGAGELGASSGPSRKVREINGANGGAVSAYGAPLHSVPFRDHDHQGEHLPMVTPRAAGKRHKQTIQFATGHNAFTDIPATVKCDEEVLLAALDSGEDICIGPCQCPVASEEHCEHGWPSRTLAIFG